MKDVIAHIDRSAAEVKGHTLCLEFSGDVAGLLRLGCHLFLEFAKFFVERLRLERVAFLGKKKKERERNNRMALHCARREREPVE
jgi:hypothetical protein